MSLQASIDNLTGAAARIEAALAAQATAETNLTAANARIADLEGRLSAAPNAARVTELEGQVAALTTRAETAEASLAVASEQLGTFDQRVTEAANAEAARIVASNGHAPVSTVGKKIEAKTCTRSEFDAMNQCDRSAFFKSGGKISQ